MSVKLITNDTLGGLTKLIKSYMPTKFNTLVGTIWHNVIVGYASGLVDSVAQINQAYNNTFIKCASGEILDERIGELTGLLRKDDETDDDFRNRYYDILLNYNISPESVSGMIFDFTGQYPLTIIEFGKNNCFWVDVNNPPEDNDACFYDDDNFDYQGYWTDFDDPEDQFTTYIVLKEKPSEEILDCIIEILEIKKIYGTKIYLTYPSEATCTYDSPFSVYDVSTYDICTGSVEPPVVQNGVLFEFGTANFTDTSGNNNNGVLSGALFGDSPSRITFEMNGENFNDESNNTNNGVLSGGAFGSSTTQIEYEMIGENFDDSSTNNNDGVLS